MSLAIFQQLGPLEIFIAIFLGLILITSVLWIWAIVDVIVRSDLSHGIKLAWILALIIFSLPTAVVYHLTKIVEERRRRPSPVKHLGGG